MTIVGRATIATTVATAALVGVWAVPASAHGLGGRSDLPLPAWMFLYGAAGALVVSFAALAAFWPAARFEGGVVGVTLAPDHVAVTRLLVVFGRALGLAVFTVIFLAAAFGDSAIDANLAPVFIYVIFWVGVQLISALVGDVWRVLSPFDTLAAIGQRLRRTSTRPTGAPSRQYDLGHWPAVVLLFAFLWLELVYPDGAEPRVLAVAIIVYTAVVLAGAARWGRPWLRQGEAFAAFFGVLAHMAPIYRDAEGRLRVRPPLAGLAALEKRRGLEALVLLALGATTFDGVTRTRFWTDLTEDLGRWGRVPVDTLGLLWAIGMVTVTYIAALRVTAQRRERQPGELASEFIHSLVPIALAYAVAHYFSLLVFEGQSALALASDPLGRGWDLFGTAGRARDLGVVSTTTIAYVQAGAIVTGHVAGVVLAHDRALALFPPLEATKSQYPLLAAMVLFTVSGLALLLGT